MIGHKANQVANQLANDTANRLANEQILSPKITIAVPQNNKIIIANRRQNNYHDCQGNSDR